MGIFPSAHSTLLQREKPETRKDERLDLWQLDGE
jgi:hypothetical protein